MECSMKLQNAVQYHVLLKYMNTNDLPRLLTELSVLKVLQSIHFRSIVIKTESFPGTLYKDSLPLGSSVLRERGKVLKSIMNPQHD